MGCIRREIRRALVTDAGSSIELSVFNNETTLTVVCGSNWSDIILEKNELKDLIELIKEIIDEGENNHETQRLSGGIDKGT